ncbi:hypothetical protein FHU38_002454 [Saccharomonospora amisosensis]|uniref:Tn3 transposase DDE domain-containing protein n=1 Tax=Saccharomonospora amisosensis TaxID=1128677 RepID=A0A7X5UQ50_9PSEU|nr:hypothetical protein [Saccharomonospora amisosensis]
MIDSSQSGDGMVLLPHSAYRPNVSAGADHPRSNIRYLVAAITELRAGGYEARDDDAARLSPFVRHHINMLGRYSFLTPELAGGPRP